MSALDIYAPPGVDPPPGGSKWLFRMLVLLTVAGGLALIVFGISTVLSELYTMMMIYSMELEPGWLQQMYVVLHLSFVVVGVLLLACVAAAPRPRTDVDLPKLLRRTRNALASFAWTTLLQAGLSGIQLSADAKWWS